MLGATLALLGLPLVERISGIEDMSGLTGIIICLLPLAWWADGSIGIFRIFNHFETYSRIQWITGILKVSLMGTAAVLSPTPAFFAAAYVISTFAGSVLKYIALKRLQQKERFAENVSAMTLREAYKSGFIIFLWHKYLNNSLRAMAAKMDIIVLSAFVPKSVVGVYRAALYTGNIAGSAITPIFAAYFPEVLRLVKMKEFGSARTLTGLCCVIALLLGSVAWLVFYLVGERLIDVFFGPQFSQSYPLGLIYLGSIVISIAVSPLYPLILALGDARSALRSQTFAVSGFALVLVPATALFGAYGTAASHIAYYSFWLVATLLYLRHFISNPAIYKM